MERLLLIAALVSIAFFVTEKSDIPQILPEAGYCTEVGQEVSYSTLGGEPIEFCKLDDFCRQHTTSTVRLNKSFDQKLLNEFKLLFSDYYCFEDEALNKNESFKSKFVCCNKYNLDITKCEPNICDGRYTGMWDVHGCKLYAIPLCSPTTNCVLINGTRSCDPVPIGNETCTWKTANKVGKTIFTNVSSDCNILMEYKCGQNISYSYHNLNYTLQYDNPIKSYTPECGGYKDA